MPKKKPKRRPARQLIGVVPMQELASRLNMEKEHANRIGLYRTGRAIDRATKVIGWEIAHLLIQAEPEPSTEAGRRRRNRRLRDASDKIEDAFSGVL